MRIPPFPTLLAGLRLAAAATPLVSIDTVPIGDPGNAAASAENVTYDPNANSDALGYGAVAYEYRIGTTEVTITQYKTFLEAVATVPTADYITDLWDRNMETDANSAGISRSGNGTPGNPYVYSVVAGTGNHPITYVNWFDAARFVNWLQNGATTGADTETGAYTLNGATSGVISRNAAATWWLPSEDEWYKAAYYSPALNGGAGGYTLHATQSDTLASNVVGTPGGANFRQNGLFATTQSSVKQTDENYLTDVGAYAGSVSAYGTFDQNGNAWEWTETVVDGLVNPQYRIRNGSWIDQNETLVGAAGSLNAPPTTQLFDIGFRVATAAVVPPKPTPAPSPSPDTTNPQVTISGKKNRTTSKARISISGKAGDNVAVKLVKVKVGNKSYKAANGTGPWKFNSKLQSGKNKILVIALDAAGNTSKKAKLIVRRKD